MRTLRTVLGPNHPPPPPPPPSCCEMPPFSDHLQTGLGLGGANGRLWEVHTTILCCMLVSHARTFLFIGGSPGGPFVLFFVVLLLRRNSLVVTSLWGDKTQADLCLRPKLEILVTSCAEPRAVCSVLCAESALCLWNSPEAARQKKENIQAGKVHYKRWLDGKQPKGAKDSQREETMRESKSFSVA